MRRVLTRAFMVKRILQAAGIRAGLIGTVRYEIGERVIPAQRTTPESLEIHQMMAQKVRADCQACVMEVSSHALDQKRVFGVEFDVAIFTNQSASQVIFRGDVVVGPITTDYKFTAPGPGTYYFHCDVHPTMNGTVTVR